MQKYDVLSKQLTSRIESERANGNFINLAFPDQSAVRRIDNPHDRSCVLRSNFIRDVDKILNCPFYNRYSDKTQVFSLNKNDDITHRSLHVQLVSRIARTIGKALNLNLELIEAIALGHDIGHTPFGHLGEKLLDQLFFANAGKHFNHNIHSVRVLDEIFPLNLTLQTLDGIACHNGEIEMFCYTPSNLTTFEQFDKHINECYVNAEHNKELIPATLEGCVVRVCDIIAYLGKDRQDAQKSKLDAQFTDFGIGKINAEIINNMMVSIVENSYGNNYIVLDSQKFNALAQSKAQNYEKIYNYNQLNGIEPKIKMMMQKIYERIILDLKNNDLSSPVFTHHINYINAPYYAKKRATPYEKTDFNQIAVDYIASMTDDYFIDLYKHLFPNDNVDIEYIDYFENI